MKKLLNLLGGLLGLDGWSMPITGADGGGEAGSGADGEPGGTGDGDGDDKGGEGGDGDGAAGGKAGGGSDGKSDDSSGDDFKADLEGKTEAELRTILIDVQKDRSKKNKRIEKLTTATKELIEAKKKLTEFERAKLSDDEKLAADLKAKTEKGEAQDKTVRDLRLKLAANSAPTKAKEADFVKFKIGAFLDANPDATDEDLAEEAAKIHKANPSAFEGNGDGVPLDTGGGGASPPQGRAALQSQLEAVNEKLKNRAMLSMEDQAALGAAQVRLELAIGKMTSAGA